MKKRLIISVVSHNHQDVIIKLGTLKDIAEIEDVVVICRDNVPVKKLKDYCESLGIIYIANEKPLGFAENNNRNFKYYLDALVPQDDEFFLVLNPDVMISKSEVNKLQKTMVNVSRSCILTIDLFLDKKFTTRDDNIRYYPRFIDFVRTFLFNSRETMLDRTQVLSKERRVWCSGAFLLMKQSLYRTLGGFNECFFMYCEDIELCYRANKLNVDVEYLSNIRAVHFRHRDSKKFMSKHFFWHVKSVFLYQMCKLLPQIKRSCILE
ncbi:glycosyltransferase family 2 protein [Aliikangiella sp. G2MR2-5]|uniref:glycosyltransferase family 2 protein n=1 Tax=Aliikangiella sp. G2MR2-5 TaxID=2788943 RepID=UPI0018AB55D7|nr:glycosyltransferase family 2 protein [Aliikangiella sp. G2MR2-5]